MAMLAETQFIHGPLNSVIMDSNRRIGAVARRSRAVPFVKIELRGRYRHEEKADGDSSDDS